uniref:flagellin n=1 Tax=Phenylobacterium sp. TaxID=1871053 RepID=UPI00286B7630
DGVRQAIAESLASGRADTLMQDIQGYFRNSVEGMNSRYGGKYLFAGGKIDTQPVSATALADLTNPGTPLISDFFHNDEFITQAKIDDSTTVNTGLLADDLGTDLLQAFKDIQVFEESGAGPFTGVLTPAQETFLEGVLATWDTVHRDIVNETARNGMVQKRVESVKKDLVSRQDSLQGMIGEITDADMTLAATALQQAQLSVQAAAQVFLSLQNSSLLNVLQP